MSDGKARFLRKRWVLQRTFLRLRRRSFDIGFATEPKRFQRVFRYLLSGDLKDSYALCDRSCFRVLGPAEEKRAQLQRARGIQREAIRTNYACSPLSEDFGMPRTILASLELNRSKVITGINSNPDKDSSVRQELQGTQFGRPNVPSSFHVRQHFAERSHMLPVVLVQVVLHSSLFVR